jgi:predicted Zn-dependent protease with MMP-like domain
VADLAVAAGATEIVAAVFITRTHLADECGVTADAVVLDDTGAYWPGHNGLVKILKRESLGVSEAVFSLDQIFCHRMTGQMAVVAGGVGVVAGLLPAVIMVTHDMAVHAGLRFIAKVGEPLTFMKGIRPCSDKNSEQPKQKENRCIDGCHYFHTGQQDIQSLKDSLTLAQQRILFKHSNGIGTIQGLLGRTLFSKLITMNTDWTAIADHEVQAVCAALPADLRACLADLRITLDPRPRPDEELEEGDDENLLGLFEGPCYAEFPDNADPMPSAIRLYIENLRDEAEDDPKRFRHEVRKTLLHELGHYLGLEEEDLDKRGLA